MALLRLLTRCPPPTASHVVLPRRPCTLLRPQLLRKSLPQQAFRQRTFASAPSPRTPVTKPAGPRPTSGSSSARLGQDTELPERLLIYHAGTGRITFLAFLKVTTVFSAAFFCLVAAPSWIRSGEEELLTIASKIAFGVTPLLFVAYTSASYATYIYLRLPLYARQSRAVLERYVRTLPAQAQLEIGTMGLAGRPRVTLVSVSDLRPASGRLGTVNFDRDVSALAARRKWHHYRPVGKFLLPDAAGAKTSGATGGGGRGSGNNRYGVKDGWVWDVIRASLDKRK
ncbi:hypothetical protein C8035_v003600 [Colletotrichum spinosum]|uniref:Uncharacterized protein n=1 Tax=Colletotrichum spinosum TaxID=1347390 RepID=A0A4R8QV84_9PEZI|nr:hypothetical protein C8035_v003600 [Colletotrichum spinosum]